MPFGTDEPLWYNVGAWGELGYAVPNFGDDPATLNSGIHYLVQVVGRNLFAVMHHADVDLRTPPSINTLTRVHKLILRARTILAGREVPPGKPNMEAVHSSPSQAVHVIFPVPYFRVRNPWLREYCGLVLGALSEATQHTDNRRPYEISTAFSGLVGQYLHRIYKLMATELFGAAAEKAEALDFALTEADLKSYDPGKWFTATEMVDTIPPLDRVATEDDLAVLSGGIPATLLVGLARWPSGLAGPSAATAPAAAGSATAAAAPAFAPPPSP